MKQLLAQNIRLRRNAAGLSQACLAARTGLSQTWISRLESGNANPTIETLQTLAEVMSIPVSDLLLDKQATHQELTGADC
ncbi:MAG: helix-turn-helix transcriptional regulator [Lamprobacter sp.]|uniref:helix-turn-helix domain-containing protein n=1 Tax=Lamprobacter sp. TaxID=3100796 RepID=UPI002B25BD32|nr:helix-turn-helix transcriptional regulator [Lamprobacter sp.]MEA3640241.1 helix-turn-helix transcriptional regulator [Lamprobacter sp.]